MARQPIILESNLIQDGFGALPSNYYGSGDAGSGVGTVQNEDGTYTIPTYQIESNTPTFDLSEMQNIYGTEYMPMFNWINQSQTGSYVYDPKEDTKEIDALKEKFEIEQGIAAEEALAERKAMYKAEAIGLGGQIVAGVGGQLGRAAAAAGGIQEGASNLYDNFKAMDVFRAPKTGPGAKVQFSPGSKNANFAAGQSTITGTQATALKNELPGLEKVIAADATTAGDIDLQNKAIERKANINKATGELTGTGNTSILSGVQDRSGFNTVDGKMSAAGKANIGGSLGAGAATIAYNLATGKNLKESVKAGAKVGLGTYIGTALGGGFGGMIGGLIGGRVICNELMRQGLLTRKEVLLDYRFTRDYLTPTHVNGYHVWAVWMVKQMRQGKFVKFWKHIAGHRANEISYIYGERAKPDYLGKVYRKILEPICWSIGFFCKATDWSVLYKQKEI